MTDDKLTTKEKIDALLQVSDKVIEIYGITVDIVRAGIEAGKTNTPLGLLSLLVYVDLLHGGAYRAPVQQRPYFMPDSEKPKSPYYAGDLKNAKQGEGIGGFFASIFAGQNAGDMWEQIITDANVPHVLPKILSDEVYAQFAIGYAQFQSTQLFQQASTGVSTLVEGLKVEPGKILERSTRQLAALAATKKS